MMVTWALAALAVAAPDQAEAADVTVTGQVLARGSRDPVVGAALTVDGAPAGETDGDGRFTLALAPGHHVLQVQQPGHDPLTRPIELAPGAPALVLRLEPAGTGPRYETVVRAPANEAPRVSLGRDEITTTPGSLGDPFRVIESLPGVAPLLWPLPIYAVRGANPGNTGFYVDGLRAPGLFHFALGPAVIHPYFLETLDFYPGGAPARYGRYVAGVVAASTAAPPADRPHASVDARLFDAGGIVSTPFDGHAGTIAVAGRYGYPGALLTALDAGATVAYWDYQARIDHRLGPGRLTLFAFGSFDRLDIAPTADEPRTIPQRLGLSFHRADLRWRGAAAGGQLTVAVGAGLDETIAPFTDNALTARGRSLLPRLVWGRGLGRAVDLELGAEGELAGYDTQVTGDNGTLADFARPRQTEYGALHGSLVLRLGDRVVVTPGARLDAFAEGDARAVDAAPRLLVRVRAAEGLWLEASGGHYTQMPSLPLQVPGFEGFGLAQHGLQSSWQGALGARAALPATLSLDATTYVQRYTLTDIRDPDLGDPLLDDFLVRREGLAYGLELMLRRAPTARLHGWLSYTLSRSLRAFEGNVVGPADWDERHILNLVAGYRWRHYTLGGRFHLHTGRPVKIGNTTPADFARLPPFYQLDLRADRLFVYDAWRLDLYLELVNTTLTDEVVALRRTRTGLEQQGFRIVLPSIGVRAEF